MITVVIPSIPPRVELLNRALASVENQKLRPDRVVVEVDVDRSGAAVTRQRGLERVETPWVAFLDDDDEFLPEHLEACFVFALENDADYVYPWYTVITRQGKTGHDPMPAFFGKPWDNDQPHQTTITTLVRTELAQSVGFQDSPGLDPNGGKVIVGGEDYRFTLGCMFAGAKIMHLPQRTWLWHHHGKNTSGLADRW